MDRSRRLAVVVLAAGAGTRFSDNPGEKLLAEIDGQALLGRVLREVRRFGPAATVVVLGHGAERIETAIEWTHETRVINAEPDRGLASSLRLGLETLLRDPTDVDGTFVVLGDQPFVRAEVMQDLAAAASAARPDRPVVVPRYDEAEGARNPVLLLRPAWTWVHAIEGDRGLGSLIESRPGSVLDVPVGGTMPDVDTTADLRRLERLLERLED
jgi:molybdenum cofactor cytidylyltransferase